MLSLSCLLYIIMRIEALPRRESLPRDRASKLIYAIGAVVGLIGGVKVYGKFSSGDPDTSKTAASWFGACIFLIVAATILRSFFL